MSEVFLLESLTAVAGFDLQTGQLVSFKSKASPDTEYIAVKDGDPAFIVQYLQDELMPSDNEQFVILDSNAAQDVEISVIESDLGYQVYGQYRNLNGTNLCVTTIATANPDDPKIRFDFTLDNPDGLPVTDVQYPMILCAAGEGDEQKLLWPSGPGQLIPSPTQRLWADEPWVMQFRPENGDAYHYPGYVNSQFMALMNGPTGLYVASEDNTGRLKQIKPAVRDGRLRLGFGHWGDWDTAGTHDLGYEVVMTGFAGDWYAAATLYRDWSLQQPWATPLYQREDVPQWLLDSPPHIIVRIQGEIDDGPGEPNEEFLPYPKIVPLLAAIEEQVNSPLVAVIMSWERPGPWVYPDCFPPAGGFESLAEFCGLARERGWHVGSFCNGTRWVMGHKFTGYDGREFYEREHGENCICRTANGRLWAELWDDSWRPSFPCCPGVEQTHELAVDFVKKLRDTGLDWIQFLDQNVGCCGFACYSRDHGHDKMPGRWMQDGMKRLTDTFLQLGAEENALSGREMVFSVECPINEYFIPQHQVCDIRVVPPGHTRYLGGCWVPLYHFLYHELIVIQGGFGMAPEPYHMPIRNAYNLVVGQIPGGVLRGDGQLLDIDTENWGPWDKEVGNNEHSLAVLRATTELRRGAAKDWLVFGQMQAPATVDNIDIIEWEYEDQPRAIPAIFHSAWTAPDGRFALVLANWTTEDRCVAIEDARLINLASAVSVAGLGASDEIIGADIDLKNICVPALGCMIIFTD